MKILNFFAFLFLIGISFTCTKKKYPAPEVIEGGATYYSKLSINNSPVTLEAGVNGYYMYSSFNKDTNNIYSFIGDLKQVNCTNCPNSLKVQINDYKISLANSSPKIDSALQVSTYPYQTGDPEPSYLVQFESLSSTESSYLWDFGDGSTDNIRNPIKFYDKPGKYNVCLTTTNANSCKSSICNKEKIDISPNSCKASISVSSAFGNTILFNSSVSYGKPNYQYLWNFGDGTTANVANPSHTYKYRGAYSVFLRVVDAYGDTAVVNYNAKTATDNSSCAANYNRSTISLIPSTASLSHIVVTWVDENGVVYTSNNTNQPLDGYFEIVSVSEGEKNENNQPTKKIMAKFKCKVYNGNKSISIDNAEVVLCVAYK